MAEFSKLAQHYLLNQQLPDILRLPPELALKYWLRQACVDELHALLLIPDWENLKRYIQNRRDQLINEQREEVLEHLEKESESKIVSK